MSKDLEVRPELLHDLGGDASRARHETLPVYVQEALRGLTGAQKRHVLAGCLSGDFTMTMVRTLQRKALFYHHIDSPNGRCGPMRLTPLGETVRRVLQKRSKALGEVAGSEAQGGHKTDPLADNALTTGRDGSSSQSQPCTDAQGRSHEAQQVDGKED